MKLWHKKSIVLIFGIILFLVGQYFLGTWIHTEWSYICQGIQSISGTYCHSPYLGIGSFGLTFIVLGQIFSLVSFTYILVGIILLFANSQVFQEWLRFSYWYVPISIFIILIMYSGTRALLGGEAPIVQGIGVFMDPYIIVTAYIVAVGVISFVKRKPL